MTPEKHTDSQLVRSGAGGREVSATLKVSNHYEPNDRFRMNIRNRPVRPRLPSGKRVNRSLATNIGRMRICLTLELIPSFRLIL
jgi:hypothetical protein